VNLASLLWLIPALPLLGFLVNGLVGKRLPNPVVALVGCLGPAPGFVLSGLALLQVQASDGPARVWFDWIRTADVTIAFGLQVDPLTAVMLLVVTGVGTAIHVYSYGYMHEDPGFSRFFAYLNLFMFSMLVLVMADNLLLMFVGWEGVGLCSYLLIGFWYEDLANVDAGRKAFVVNRIGDFAFLVGMFTLFSLTGSLDYDTLQASIGSLSPEMALTSGPFAGWTASSVLQFAALCLFIGATGKSAQIPLYVWLPDAMAGPTPVSALIHAATMVTAGVYMIGRLDFLYVMTPAVMSIVAVVAASTAFLSGIIAVAQTDIKKVLAYSTVSQLGFMFVGMASTAFHTGLFHVVTHAFFKALLFLGAGAVIHALHGEQDIRKMGGLWKDMRGVAVLFLVGSLALGGMWPFAGFFSKDQILAAAHAQMAHSGGVWALVFALLVATALLTAFYTTRLVLLVFFGPPADPHRHPHATHWTMMAALVLLAALSAAGGLLGEPLAAFTEPAWAHAMHGITAEDVHHSHWIAVGASVSSVGVGFASAMFLFRFRRSAVEAFVSGPGKQLHWVVQNKFFVDELYHRLVVGPLDRGATLLWSTVDRALIDSFLVEGSGRFVYGVGGALRRTQAGAVNAATVAMMLGALAMLGYLLWGLVAHA
jgi:NADH-quinone oxidoreductase subunit L